MPKTQEWIKTKLREEERKLGVNVEYNNMRLTKELETLKQRISDLELVIEELMKND